MEIIIGLLVVGGIACFFFMRNGKKEEVAAPYKVEASAPVAEPVKAETPKVEVIPAGTEASIAAPAKKAPAKPKAAAKPKATAATKAPAKTAKTKAPAKPKVTVAK